MRDFIPIELVRLADYFAVSASDTEKEQVEQWIATSPKHRDFVEALNRSRLDFSRSLVNEVQDAEAQLDLLSTGLSEAINRDQSTISFPQQRERESYSFPQKTSIDLYGGVVGRGVMRRETHPWQMILGWGLIAALLVFGVTEIADLRNLSKATGEFSTYTTSNGERATVTLSDGTTIQLNVNSRVDVPANYGISGRTIILNGQAYFHVAPDTKTPFVVRAGPSLTQVLGTEFMVRNYATDSSATVMVKSGKVMVNEQIVTAAQQVTVTESGVSEIQKARQSSIDFINGVLTIKGMLLPDAIVELNRWYDVDVRLGDTSLYRREVDGGFVAGSISDLQSILELMYDVHIVRNNRTLTLLPRR